MAYQEVRAVYRFAEHPDEIPAGRVVTVTDLPGECTVVIRPGHARPCLLWAIQDAHQATLALQQWIRLDETTPGVASHPRRLTEAVWRFEAGLPEGLPCMPLEEPGRHTWLIRPGQASEELVKEISELLTAFVRSGIWVQRWGGHDTPLSA
jgi:hypothetical protein